MAGVRAFIARYNAEWRVEKNGYIIPSQARGTWVWGDREGRRVNNNRVSRGQGALIHSIIASDNILDLCNYYL